MKSKPAILKNLKPILHDDRQLFNLGKPEEYKDKDKKKKTDKKSK